MVKRRPWMKTAKAYKWNAEGTMTQETARAWRACDSRVSKDAHEMRSDGTRPIISDYARALGISYREAESRAEKQREILRHA